LEQKAFGGKIESETISAFDFWNRSSEKGFERCMQSCWYVKK
jgi:hypothetical protein